MGNKAAQTRWFRPWRTTPVSRLEDPAEMGTAFGLDLSLNASQPEQPATTTTQRPANWVSRWAQRRKAA
jgi:hypothetical protein